MSEGLTYLITGANRGIGLALAKAVLQRPNTTAIACYRSPQSPGAQDLGAIPHHPTSTLITHALDSRSDSATLDLITSLRTQHGIQALDVVIANAGSATAYSPVVSTPLEALRSDYETNTLGPIKLFQASAGLLSRSPRGGKFILVSSVLGSIGVMGVEAGPVLSYGSSKAAANFAVRKIHLEHPELVALAIHPGWVKTSMGQGFADVVGVKEPPMTVEESAKGVLEQIDLAAKDKTSGAFISYDGKALPW